MKKTTLKFLFLIIAGLVIGWREWNTSFSDFNAKTNGITESVLNAKIVTVSDWNHFQEIGSATEASSVFWLLLLGALVVIVVNWMLKAPLKLSSPNSV